VRRSASPPAPSITYASLDAQGQKLLSKATGRLKLSARGYHRVLRVARTIADLAGSADVGRPHLADALSYRRIVLER
jgi:magnesium chelatase family protein